MALYRETTGSGPDLVLLHGWGLHGGIFGSLAAALGAAHRVTLLDLPGHGHSPLEPPFHDLDTLACAVAADLPGACTLVGWSLGGLVALRLASMRIPQVRRLVLVATTPRFVAGPDWPHGLASEVVEEFALELARDHRAVLDRFLALQARGDERQRALIRELRLLVHQREAPRPAALAAGLDVLREADLRVETRHVRAPTLVIGGAYDRLTPPAAGRYLAEHVPSARHVLMPRASHAPFLSHPDGFLHALGAFLGETLPIAEPT